jgi:RimJ/RimL family protein N-acetyltransferase
MQTDPEVRRYVGGQAWPADKAVYRFRHQFLGRPAKTYGLWATVLKAENRYIGFCGLSSHTADGGRRNVNVAYYLARPYWGRGLATEACNAFVEIAFSNLKLKVLCADVEKGNDASEHILQKLGFVFVRREEIPGRIFHSYELSRESWTSLGANLLRAQPPLLVEEPGEDNRAV